MLDIINIMDSTYVDIKVAAVRLVVSFIACGLIGLEREMHRQTAGWRTHIIIGLGATLLMLVSIWLPQTIGSEKGDPARIAAQVVSGIGFLGAGAFIKIGNNIKGLTTASTLWFVAGLGLAIGGGIWKAALVALTLALLALIVLDPIEKKWFPSERVKLLQIWYSSRTIDRQAVQKTLKQFHIQIHTVDADLSVKKNQTKLSALVMVPINIDMDALFFDLCKTGDVTKIRLHENY